MIQYRDFGPFRSKNEHSSIFDRKCIVKISDLRSTASTFFMDYWGFAVIVSFDTGTITTLRQQQTKPMPTHVHIGSPAPYSDSQEYAGYDDFPTLKNDKTDNYAYVITTRKICQLF